MRQQKLDPSWPYCYWTHPRDVAPGADNTTDVSRRKGRLISVFEIMRYYDRLPQPIRQVLANADHPWAPDWCSERLACGWTVEQIIKRLAAADCKRRDEHELELVGLRRPER